MADGTMRCARMHAGGGELRLEDVPIPDVGRDEVRVGVRATGICGTELHFLDGFYEPARLPMILGHEVAGEVLEVGAEVDGWAPGDRVVSNYYLFCGRCTWCLRGQHQLCLSPRGWMAFRSDGGFAEQVVVPAYCLVRLPDSLPYTDAAPLCCSAATAIHATARASIAAGELVVVYGTGGVGLSIVQVATRVRGAKVIAIDRSEESRQAALRMGASAAVDAAGAAAAVADHSGGAGADAVFELVGRAETLSGSLDLLGRRGRLVLLGYSEDQLVVPPFLLVASEQSVIASAGNTQGEIATAVDLAARDVIGSVVSDVRPFDEVNEQIARLRVGRVHGRVVLTFGI